jgi:hypothetical protein
MQKKRKCVGKKGKLMKKGSNEGRREGRNAGRKK